MRRAAAAQVELLFLTDHDSVTGFPEALEAAKGTGVDLRCGIEINTIFKDNVHILGYGIRWDSEPLRARLGEFRVRRRARIERILENLKKLGFELTMDEVRAAWHESGKGAAQSAAPTPPEGADESLGRPHVADALKRKGVVRSRQEAFNRFLAKGKPGYVDSAGPTPEEAIALIRAAGGFCSIAHPETIAEPELIKDWIKLGLEGLEVYYSTHTPSQTVRFRDIADRWDLLPTGGTDFHGPGSGRDKALGVELPDEAYGRFMERLSRCS